MRNAAVVYTHLVQRRATNNLTHALTAPNISLVLITSSGVVTTTAKPPAREPQMAPEGKTKRLHTKQFYITQICNDELMQCVSPANSNSMSNSMSNSIDKSGHVTSSITFVTA